jgi:hypothetical protein
VADDRLESLEVRALEAPTLPHTTQTDRREKPRRVMKRLTHLRAALATQMSARILASMPRVCRGELVFQTAFRVAAAGFVRARLASRRDASLVGSRAVRNGASDGNDDDDDDATVDLAQDRRVGQQASEPAKQPSGRSSPTASKAALREKQLHRRSGTTGGGGNDIGECRVSWYQQNGLLDASDVFARARDVAEAMSELRVRWIAHKFDTTVTGDTRREIRARLPLATTTRPTPPTTTASKTVAASATAAAPGTVA